MAVVGLRAATIGVLQHVARIDPVTWVRDAAETALPYLTDWSGHGIRTSLRWIADSAPAPCA